MRSIHLAAAVAVATVIFSASAQPLTESDAISRALARREIAELERAERDAARSFVSGSFLWANPSVSILEEPAGADREETTIAVTQELDLGGRGLRVEAAKTRGAAKESDIVFARLDVARRARLAFYELLAAERNASAVEAWRLRIARGSETIAALEKGGEVSGYDRRRADRELLSIDARARSARARAVAARERLAAMLAVEPEGFTVTGDLLPDEPEEVSALIDGLAMRPDIAAEALRADAAALDTRAARRWWLPSASLTAGQKTLADDSDGTLLGAAVSIPIFDRRQPERLAATSEERAARATRDLLLSAAAGEVRARAAEARALRASAVAFRESATASSDALLEIATVAYRAGEIGILELLDASRSAIDADTELIDLELRARIAAIELRYAAGPGAGETNATETAR